MAKRLCIYEGKPSVYYVVADVNYLPFRNEAIKIITAASIFEHIPDNPKVFDEIKRTLEPDRIFISGLPIEVGVPFLIKQIFFRIINWLRQDPVSISEILATFSYGDSHGPKWKSDHLDYNWKRTVAHIRARFSIEKTEILAG